MIITDTLTFDAPRRTKEGYLAVRAKSARVGIQDYLGYEVDPNGEKFAALDRVAVYRPEEEVFSEKSVHSFLMKPITNDHPSEPVTSQNWSKLAKGVVAKAMRDGDHLNFDLIFMDGQTIADIEGGKRELSNGYGVELEFKDGVTPDGKPYQAVQRSIVGNHVALVKKGRAGPDCAIGVCDAISPEVFNHFLDNIGEPQVTLKPVTITLDGASHVVELSDAAAILVGNLQTKLNDAQAQVGTLTATVSTKDGEIVALKSQLADATLTPAKLDAAVAERSKVITDAKRIFPALVADGKDLPTIRKEAVVHKIADAATLDDNAIVGAFSALVAVTPVTKTTTTDSLANGLSNVEVKDVADEANKARASRYDRFRTAHTGQHEKAN